MSTEDNKIKVEEYCAKYVFSTDQLKNFQNIYITEIKKGLAKATHNTADIKCHISYVTDLPDGSERGSVLALDLGGTNFRVLLVNLIGAQQIEMESKIYTIPSNLMTDEGEKLFDHIVDCLEDFINIHDLKNTELPLGFTFSFPVNQLGLQKGLLVRWTKGFNCAGVVGKNVVELLEDAIRRKGGIQVRTVAILNDTVGTLMSCALDNHNCRIGLIVGTGSNACYLENVSVVENWDTSKSDATTVIINTECGAFGDNGCIDFFRSDEDKYVDANSLNKGQQFFEKMISGMYMGEIVRLIILKLVNDKVLFNGNQSDVLNTKDAFKTAYLSEIESDQSSSHTNCQLVLKELRLDKHATDADCENILYICQCVSRRSAYLVSAAMAGLIDKINEPNVTIGVDGTVYRLHPHYHNLMVEKIGELINPQLSFEVMLSDDGSGKGAAIIAAVAARKLYSQS